MEVRVLGRLRELVGDAAFELPGDDVRELLRHLAERGDAELARWLFTDEQGGGVALHRDLRVLVNGRSIEFLRGVDTQLADGDSVTVHLAGARGFPGG